MCDFALPSLYSLLQLETRGKTQPMEGIRPGQLRRADTAGWVLILEEQSGAISKNSVRVLAI